MKYGFCDKWESSLIGVSPLTSTTTNVINKLNRIVQLRTSKPAKKKRC